MHTWLCTWHAENRSTNNKRHIISVLVLDRLRQRFGMQNWFNMCIGMPLYLLTLWLCELLTSAISAVLHNILEYTLCYTCTRGPTYPLISLSLCTNLRALLPLHLVVPHPTLPTLFHYPAEKHGLRYLYIHVYSCMYMYTRTCTVHVHVQQQVVSVKGPDIA